MRPLAHDAGVGGSGIPGELARQQSVLKREVREEAESEALRCRKHFALRTAGEQAVVVLRRDERHGAALPRDEMRLGRLPAREVRVSDIADLALAHQVAQRVERLVDRRRRVGGVQLVEVDPVRLKAGEGCLDRATHVGAGCFRTAENACREVDVPELRREDDVVASALQRLAHEGLGEPRLPAVDVRGVEEGHAGVDRGIQDVAGAVERLGLGAGAAEVVAAEADG